tara:strand:- start:15791 stop:16738 length:948 start_codon:yes stop_codon:yes gene_type:complete
MFMSAWGTNQTNAVQTNAPKVTYGEEYFRERFKNNLAQSVDIRMALVARENCGKTGLALSMLDDEIKAGKKVAIFDVDNSAKSTVDYIYPNAENIMVIPLHDETDDSIFNEDNSVNHKSLLDKTSWFVNILADEIAASPDDWGGVIFDGGSTFLKWCEHAMRTSLLDRGIIETEDGTFNQKEWRERNRLNRGVLNRLHSLPVNKVFFTFHLKDIKEFMDDGTGKKVMMSVGEVPEWEKGTMRLFSQQIFLARYMKKADLATGVKGDKKLAEGEWVIKATIEEMKGKNMEHLGSTHTILSVKDNKVTWTGLPVLKW